MATITKEVCETCGEEMGYHKRGLCEKCKILEKHAFNCTPDDPCFDCKEKDFLASQDRRVDVEFNVHYTK